MAAGNVKKWALVLQAVMLILLPGATQAAAWKTFNDAQSGISFSYPGQWRQRPCLLASNDDAPQEMDSESVRFIACFKGTGHRLRDFAAVGVSLSSVEQVAREQGWNQVKADDIKKNDHPSSLSEGDWLSPGIATPEAAEKIVAGSWKGLSATNAWPYLSVEGIRCSACGAHFSSIVNDGRATVLIEYTSARGFLEGDDNDKTTEKMLQSLRHK